MKSINAEKELLQSLVAHCGLIATSERSIVEVRMAACCLEKHFAARLAPPRRRFTYPARAMQRSASLPAEAEVLDNLLAQLRVYRQPRGALEKISERYHQRLSARREQIGADKIFLRTGLGDCPTPG